MKEIFPATGMAGPEGNLDPEGALTLVKGLVIDVVDIVHEAVNSARGEVVEQFVGFLKSSSMVVKSACLMKTYW